MLPEGSIGEKDFFWSENIGKSEEALKNEKGLERHISKNKQRWPSIASYQLLPSGWKWKRYSNLGKRQGFFPDEARG